MKNIFQIKVKLLYNKRVTGNYFHCAFLAPRVASQATPGQFVNIKVSDQLEPLLRRPLSIHRVFGSRIDILYEALGQGTKLLSQRKSGEFLDVIGPLGEGFNYEQKAKGRGAKLLVAGGMGVAPLVFLAQELTGQEPKPEVLVLIGANSKDKILCAKEFKALGCQVQIATDDGSRGFKGYVSGLLKKTLADREYRASAIYACGPRQMLEAVTRVSHKHNILTQVSWEEHMACGIGACLGCVVNTKSGFKRACKEGPVFNAEEIIW